jgi:hypothetical protein
MGKSAWQARFQRIYKEYEQAGAGKNQPYPALHQHIE